MNVAKDRGIVLRNRT